MGRFFLENNIVALLTLFGIALVAAVGFTQWDSLFASSQSDELATYIQYEWQFNPSHQYGTAAFTPVALSTKANPRLVTGVGTSSAVINSEWGTPLAWTGTGPAFTIGLTLVPTSDCTELLNNGTLAPYVTSLQVTGKSVETALPMTGDAATADCASGSVSITVTAKGHPGS